MIGLNELRVGNWLMWEDESEQLIQVDEICIGRDEYINGEPFVVYGGAHKDEALLSALIPIPLTYEILRKIEGFIYDPGTSFWDCWKRTSMRNNELVSFTFKISKDNDEWRWFEGNANIPFYYLHQLQNLYFSLTQMELMYNP